MYCKEVGCTENARFYCEEHGGTLRAEVEGLIKPRQKAHERPRNKSGKSGYVLQKPGSRPVALDDSKRGAVQPGEGLSHYKRETPEEREARLAKKRAKREEKEAARNASRPKRPPKGDKKGKGKKKQQKGDDKKKGKK
ncbi:hypothetical protein L6259_00620 [Candidatus Parcubacteria bacterium]|nr:hypothetical protein [Patescibacteria group bacterium]MCG2693776.1 hypothetical protein [Candidatus Parcubacteria bacterium]